MIISCFILIKYFMNIKTIAVFQDWNYFVLYIHDLFRS